MTYQRDHRAVVSMSVIELVLTICVPLGVNMIYVSYQAGQIVNRITAIETQQDRDQAILTQDGDYIAALQATVKGRDCAVDSAKH